MAHGFFYLAFIYLVAAVISVPVAKRLGLGSVLGYLFAGVIIGPFMLGLVGQEVGDVMHFAEFGVVMMLFLIGLELKPSRLWRLRGPILGLGGLQVLLTTFALTGIALYFGLEWKMALAIGMSLALSSTAIVLQSLNEKGLLKTSAGQSSFSVLLFQDIAVIPMLALLPLLAAPGATPAIATDNVLAGLPGWQQTLVVLLIVGAIILGGRFLTRPVFRFIAATRLREIFTAAALLIVIGITLLMQSIGLSPALGTFVAGVVLAESEYRHELEADIEPFKGLLLGVFFISVGASIDFQLLIDNPGLIAALVGGLVAVKLMILLILGRLFSMSLSDNLLFSLALAQGGEFAFVLLAFAAGASVLPTSLTNPLVVAVALSMLVTPLLLLFHERLLSPMMRKHRERREPDAIDEDNPVIIVGYGRFGQIVGRLLKAQGFSITLLDHDSSQIELVRKFGNKVFYGDAARLDLLISAGAAEARLLVLAIDDRNKVLEIAALAREHFPNLTILARAFDRSHVYKLMTVGVEHIYRETFRSALEMGTDALQHLGYRAHQAHRLAAAFRRHDEATLRELYPHWGDEKKYVFHSHQRAEDLVRLLQSEERRTHPKDHAWAIDQLREDSRD